MCAWFCQIGRCQDCWRDDAFAKGYRSIKGNEEHNPCIQYSRELRPVLIEWMIFACDIATPIQQLQLVAEFQDVILIKRFAILYTQDTMIKNVVLMNTVSFFWLEELDDSDKPIVTQPINASSIYYVTILKCCSSVKKVCSVYYFYNIRNPKQLLVVRNRRNFVSGFDTRKRHVCLLSKSFWFVSDDNFIV